MVGASGFEPPASWSRTRCQTLLNSGAFAVTKLTTVGANTRRICEMMLSAVLGSFEVLIVDSSCEIWSSAHPTL
jgi:hypothetical protein